MPTDTFLRFLITPALRTCCRPVTPFPVRNELCLPVKASLNSGWKHPLQLLLGHPQSSFVAKGSFDYYSLLVPRQGDDNEPWESIVLTLTPKYGGQQVRAIKSVAR